MKTHNLKLAAESFAAITSGSKTIESRLYDEKRRTIELGDEIIFTNREAPEQTVRTKVRGLLRYKSFEDLFSHNQPARFGGPSADWLLGQIRGFYSTEEEQKYGVVGIEFELL